MPLQTTLGEEISRYLGYVAFFITLVILPGMMIGLLFQDHSYFQSEEFIVKYGFLTEGINHRSKFTLAFYFVFILRRFLYI